MTSVTNPSRLKGELATGWPVDPEAVEIECYYDSDCPSYPRRITYCSGDYINENVVTYNSCNLATHKCDYTSTVGMFNSNCNDMILQFNDPSITFCNKAECIDNGDGHAYCENRALTDRYCVIQSTGKTGICSTYPGGPSIATCRYAIITGYPNEPEFYP